MKKLTELEDRSCQNFTLIASQKHQLKPGKLQRGSEKIIKNKLDITDDIEIDRCHSMGKFQRNESKSQLSLSFYISKINTKFFKMQKKKQKKNTGIFIYKDFCKVTVELRKFVGKKFYSIGSKTK